ncbi:uncharacterized protein C16orf78 homolog isoform X2 [Zalophus californianus]|uniref:Uncharacterized protein C16orf78 homolog isoform X2 n=1 Tax=Zalophus californianus TaxID=9704 RepID=A0A6J2F355_ZALCA|nr:uncharacterized protein C16orf78 homolog isoform X2 [Zalophus californianus]
MQCPQRGSPRGGRPRRGGCPTLRGCWSGWSGGRGSKSKYVLSKYGLFQQNCKAAELKTTPAGERQNLTPRKQKKPKGIMAPKTNGKEGKKDQNLLKQQRGNRQVAFANQPSKQSAKNAVDPKGKRLSIVSSKYTKDGPRKSDLDIKDAIALESTQRPQPYRRQSVLDPALQETPVFGGRKSTLLRDWVINRTTEISYERKLKSLMEKSTEPKVELVRMLKPEEVLSCRAVPGQKPLGSPATSLVDELWDGHDTWVLPL